MNDQGVAVSGPVVPGDLLLVGHVEHADPVDLLPIYVPIPISANRRLDLPLADAIDLLDDLGVRSPIEYDDYLQSVRTAERALRESSESS